MPWGQPLPLALFVSFRFFLKTLAIAEMQNFDLELENTNLPIRDKVR